ncbi:MAG: hypothetical protein OHK0044_08200 [Burkholderiaceae bacterium]
MGSSIASAARRAAVALIALVTAGCVVVPVNPDGSIYQGPVAAYPAVAVPAAPTSITLPVRLYPTNEVAAATGMVSGTVVNNLNGKGNFTLNVGGETMSGEATRSGGATSRQGIANAYGARGSFANCQYTMNTHTQGTGHCTFSNGATYQLHIGG